TLRLRQRVIGDDQGSRRMAEEVSAFQAERASDLGEFLDEAIEGPERLVVRMIGFSRAKLVVENDRPLLAQLAYRLKVIVNEARTAMHCYERNGVAAAHDFVPDFAAGDLDVSFLHRASERKFRVVCGCGIDGSRQKNEDQHHQYRAGNRTRTLTKHG